LEGRKEEERDSSGLRQNTRGKNVPRPLSARFMPSTTEAGIAAEAAIPANTLSARVENFIVTEA
jgi:hypothetical protein